MVTWGQNTVHTFGSTPASSVGAPAPSFGFGSPSPAPSFTFGSTPANTPAPTTAGFSFGASVPAPSTSLFGTPAPAPTTSLFGGAAPGSSTAVTGTTSLFGTPSTTATTTWLFGGAPVSLFGQPQQQQQQQKQQQQLPAQAALQAHMDASARQEQARIQNALGKIHREYTGTEPATQEKSSHFLYLNYNQATPEYQQLQWLHGMWVVGETTGGSGGGGDYVAGGGGDASGGHLQQYQQQQQQQQHRMRRPVAPPKPPQVSDRDWEQTVVRNPDHQHYMPVALVGAEALQSRLASQQERADTAVGQLKDLSHVRESIQARVDRCISAVEAMQQRQIRQRQKLLAILQRVEVFRCYNNPLQPDEYKAMEKVAHLYHAAEQVTDAMKSLQTAAAATKDKNSALLLSLLTVGGSVDPQNVLVADDQRGHESMVHIPDEDELKAVLTEHHNELGNLVATVKQDLRDLELIQRRLEATTASRIAVPTRY